MKITKDTIIGECILAHPELADVFLDFGVHCVGCFAAQMETIGQGLKLHGKSDKEITNFIKKLNELKNE
jgi:hybrid cluster-associated redox disulfide protein